MTATTEEANSVVLMPNADPFVFAHNDSTGVAIFFTIWSLVVSGSDAFLKPLFLGRGMSIPMPVILLGAIGGMVLSGIVGLFVGAVILALGYQLTMAWLNVGSEAGAGMPNPEPATPAG